MVRWSRLSGCKGFEIRSRGNRIHISVLLDPPMNRYWDGFLMDEKGDMFTVMSFPVQVNYFQRTARATPECRKVDYEREIWPISHVRRSRRYGIRPTRQSGKRFRKRSRSLKTSSCWHGLVGGRDMNSLQARYS